MPTLHRRVVSFLLARRARVLVRALIFSIGMVAALPAITLREASAQIEGEMSGDFPVGIENQDQHKAFFSLLCMCGCPRETLGTCKCGFANARRLEIKAALASGESIEKIQDDYVARWGARALAVPRNEGAKRLVWAVPLVLIVLGALAVGLVLRKWLGRAAAERIPAGPPGLEPPPSDAYDAKLDRELEELDRE